MNIAAWILRKIFNASAAEAQFTVMKELDTYALSKCNERELNQHKANLTKAWEDAWDRLWYADMLAIFPFFIALTGQSAPAAVFSLVYITFLVHLHRKWLWKLYKHKQRMSVELNRQFHSNRKKLSSPPQG